MEFLEDPTVEAFGDLLAATADSGSRLLGMYFAAWCREFNLPPNDIALCRLESQDGKLNCFYFTSMEAAEEDICRRSGTGNFEEIE